jgi:hypothetical protein
MSEMEIVVGDLFDKIGEIDQFESGAATMSPCLGAVLVWISFWNSCQWILDFLSHLQRRLVAEKMSLMLIPDEGAKGYLMKGHR